MTFVKSQECENNHSFLFIEHKNIFFKNSFAGYKQYIVITIFQLLFLCSINSYYRICVTLSNYQWTWQYFTPFFLLIIQHRKEKRRGIEDGIDSTRHFTCSIPNRKHGEQLWKKQKQRKQLIRLLKEDNIDMVKPSDAKECALRMKIKVFSINT